MEKAQLWSSTPAAHSTHNPKTKGSNQAMGIRKSKSDVITTATIILINFVIVQVFIFIQKVFCLLIEYLRN
jgi:hypothetical protein